MGVSVQQKGPEDEEELQSEINIIPLVDVMLVLLIIFMISAPMMTDQVDIELPDAQADASEADDESVIVSINDEQEIFIGETNIPFEELGNRLNQIFETRDRQEVYIQADEAVRHGFIVQVMAHIQEAGIFRIAFMTDPTE